jgi:hypothetical protein
VREAFSPPSKEKLLLAKAHQPPREENIRHGRLKALSGRFFLFHGLIFLLFQRVSALCERHFRLPERKKPLLAALKSLHERQNILPKR